MSLGLIEEAQGEKQQGLKGPWRAFAVQTGQVRGLVVGKFSI